MIIYGLLMNDLVNKVIPEVFTAVRTFMFLVLAPYRLVGRCRYLRETSSVIINTLCLSESLAFTCECTRRENPEEEHKLLMSFEMNELTENLELILKSYSWWFNFVGIFIVLSYCFTYPLWLYTVFMLSVFCLGVPFYPY